MGTMDCAQWNEAIGAILDGEDPGIDPALVDAHVARCPDCAAHREFVHGLRRAALREAEPQPDLAPRVVKAAKVADGTRTWSIPRGVLAVCAIEVVALSMPDLFGAGASHDTRHLGAFTFAYGVLLLVVVARPARARTMLPVALMLGLALAVTAVVDLVAGTVPLVNETLHVPELVSVVMVWMLAAPGRVRRSGGDRLRVRAPLRAVDRAEDVA